MVNSRRLCSALLMLFGLFSGTALAHSSRVAVDQSGVAIPFITHGEMAVLTEYHDRIIDLAQRMRQPDADFRRILRYQNLQYSACLRGLMPFSISDEESPFNECSHAYLAATKEMALRMRKIENGLGQASELVSEIDALMTARGAAFIGCQFSGEGFNTAELLRPHWVHLASHLPSLASILAFFVLPPGIAAVAGRLMRRRTRRPAVA